MGVTGIGAISFRAGDPEALAAWYAEHLGVGGGEMSLWEQQAGPTVFAPFASDTDYFPADK
jgi:glyoxylase I family protein